MKPHLLYLAFWYPPSRASGVYRAIATTKQFIASGWDVTVIACTSEFFEDEVGSVDPSLLSEVPDSVEVVRVPYSFDVVGKVDIRSLSRLTANLPTVWNVVRRGTLPARMFAAKLRGASPDVHDFTDNYVAWIDPVVRHGSKVDSGHRVDHVLATGNPYSAFEAARLLGGVLGVPYSVDYRDPWTIDVFTGSTLFSDQQTRAAERRIVDGAWRCFHVNDAIADGYRALLPDDADKQVVVYNGYDAASIPPLPAAATAPYRFGILGTVNARWPMEAIFAAWNAARSELPGGSELVMGGHLGYFAKSTDLLEAYLPDESAGFRYLGPVPKAEVADFYASVDVVILPVPGGPMVTSGKVFEANALGKPLVCVQAPDGGARRFLETNPLAVGADPDAGQVLAAILKAADLAAHLDIGISRQVREQAARFQRQNAIQPLVDAVAESLIDATHT